MNQTATEIRHRMAEANARLADKLRAVYGNPFFALDGAARAIEIAMRNSRNRLNWIARWKRVEEHPFCSCPSCTPFGFKDPRGPLLQWRGQRLEYKRKKMRDWMNGIVEPPVKFQGVEIVWDGDSIYG